MLQCGAVCCSRCSLLQSVAVCRSLLQSIAVFLMSSNVLSSNSLPMSCSVLQSAAECCSVTLQHIRKTAIAIVYSSLPSIDYSSLPYVLQCLNRLQLQMSFLCLLQSIAVFQQSCNVLQCLAECCRVLQCAAVCCRGLQSAAVCCSVL